MELNCYTFEGQVETSGEGFYANMPVGFNLFLAPESDPELLEMAARTIMAAICHSVEEEARSKMEGDYEEWNQNN